MKAYKFKVKHPSKALEERFENVLSLTRELYNSALQERIGAYKIAHKSLNYETQANQLGEIKEFRPEFNNVHSQILQAVLKRLDKTFKAFFNRVKRGEKLVFRASKAKIGLIASHFRKAVFGLMGIICFCRKSGK
jgi:putative transposase